MRPRSKTVYLERPSQVYEKSDIESEPEYTNLENCTVSSVFDKTLNSIWTVQEQESLIFQIKLQLPENDSKSYYHRISKLDWSQIYVQNRSVADCKSQLTYILKKVRHVRVLGELLEDASQSLVKPRRNLSAFNIFCQELKSQGLQIKGETFFQSAAKLYKNLPQNELKNYKEIAHSVKKRKPNVKKVLPTLVQYYKEITNNPDADLKGLTVEDKYHLIRKASDDGIKLELNKGESALLKTKGKPKRPLSALQLYMKDFSSQYKGFKELNVQFKKLANKEKKIYEEKAARCKMEYDREVALFKLRQADFQLLNNKSESELSAIEETNPDKVKKELFSPERSIMKLREKTNQTTEKDTTADELSLTPSKSLQKNKKRKESLPTDEPYVHSLGKNPKRNQSSTSFGVDYPTDTTADELDLSPSTSSHKNKKRKESFTSDEVDLAPSKKQKKDIKPENTSPTKSVKTQPDPPEPNAYMYYVKYEYKGKLKKAKRAYDNLSVEDKKRIKKLYRKSAAVYMQKLEEYLSSLTKEEMAAYAERQNEIKTEKPDSS